MKACQRTLHFPPKYGGPGQSSQSFAGISGFAPPRLVRSFTLWQYGIRRYHTKHLVMRLDRGASPASGALGASQVFEVVRASEVRVGHAGFLPRPSRTPRRGNPSGNRGDGGHSESRRKSQAPPRLGSVIGGIAGRAPRRCNRLASMVPCGACMCEPTASAVQRVVESPIRPTRSSDPGEPSVTKWGTS